MSSSTPSLSRKSKAATVTASTGTAAAANAANAANAASSTSPPAPAGATTAAQELQTGVTWSIAVYVLYRILWSAYKIRLKAIEEYGPVIHEFDPWFNYRATEVREEKRTLLY